MSRPVSGPVSLQRGGRILVLGASGTLGSGITQAALAAGLRPVLVTRSEESAARLRAEHDPEVTAVVVGEPGTPAGADGLAARLREAGRIDHVVASMGGWWQDGALTDQSGAEWERVRASLLDSHVHAARALLPLVPVEGGTYTVLTGAGAEGVARTSLLTVALGGTLALSRLLRHDPAEHGGRRVNELRISVRVEREPRDGVAAARDLGECLLRVLASDARGAVVPFDGPDGFDPRARADEPAWG